jgi:3-deoxy-manno-octulosonate cytidylyltransferase (CMP-KDO synthetase)
MTAVIVIPARYDSTRFPGKPLAPLRGKPMIQHVYENCRHSLLASDVMVATDSETIFEKVLSFGGKAVMTSPGHASGTDRVAEIARSTGCDIMVNVQGDEPLVRPEMIDDVINLLSDSRADIGTLVKKTTTPEEIMDPNVVKAVFCQEGFALYFSRAPIPFHRDVWRFYGTGQGTEGTRFHGAYEVHASDAGHHAVSWFKHIGIYSYRRDVLLRISDEKPSRLEEIEKLEQLRALENGFRIKVKETEIETMGVDTPQDLERVEKWLSLSL